MVGEFGEGGFAGVLGVYGREAAVEKRSHVNGLL